MNSFGERVTFTSFGESHGRAIGGVLDGVPAKLVIDINLIRDELLRRSGKGQVGTSARARNESDEVEWLSGVMENEDGQLVSLGTPIAFIIRNTDAHSEDYAWMKHNFRPGHADYTYQVKYGIRDWRGGGRASARETAARVVAGTIAKQLLRMRGIVIKASLEQVGDEKDPALFDNILRETQARGETISGVVGCRIYHLPAGIGEPIFDKLSSHLAAAMLSINGCTGFEYSLGIAGGISDGQPVMFTCRFKAAATKMRLYKGRHDSCIAVRAVPIVEAMAALTIINMERLIEVP